AGEAGRRLAGRDDVHGDLADPGVGADERAGPRRLDDQAAARPPRRGPQRDVLDREGAQREFHRGYPAPPKTVGVWTSAVRARRPCSTILRRSARSASGGSDGSPQTCSIATPCTTRFAPACSASGGSALITATGIFLRSISLLIVAPQRLQIGRAHV